MTQKTKEHFPAVFQHESALLSLPMTITYDD